LEEHQRTFNPKIKESSVWTLVSPLFEYFETGEFAHAKMKRADFAVEIQHRRATYDSLIAQLDTIPEPDHPNRAIEVYNIRIYYHRLTDSTGRCHATGFV
jgi:hypothetical protein